MPDCGGRKASISRTRRGIYNLVEKPLILISKLFGYNAIISARRVHSEKTGFRVLAIAESFKKTRTCKSTLAGIVMRRDLIIDGVTFGKATIEGDDATESIIAMYASLERNDVNCILLDGLVISMYNIIDGERIAVHTGIPVLAITFEDSGGLEDSIKRRFEDWRSKMEQYKKLGKRERVTLKTGKILYVRYWELSQKKAVSILNSFTLQGAVPEPVRVAKLAARACASLML
jgi:hypothetical protein